MPDITPISSHEAGTVLLAPYFISQVPAGFPSAADDYMDKKLDLNDHLIKNPAATFYCNVAGNSMVGIGIFDGDLLVVDRALKPVHGDVVLAVIDGDSAGSNQ